MLAIAWETVHLCMATLPAISRELTVGEEMANSAVSRDTSGREVRRESGRKDNELKEKSSPEDHQQNGRFDSYDYNKKIAR